MTYSRYEYLERRGEPTRAFGRQAARRPGPQRNPYPRGSRKFWLWKEGFDAERSAQIRAAAEQKVEPTPQRRPAPAARRPAGASVQRLAQLAGALSNNPVFWAWCGADCAAEAAEWIRRTCGVTSRRELDTNPDAGRLFHERVRRPFAASRDQ